MAKKRKLRSSEPEAYVPVEYHPPEEEEDHEEEEEEHQQEEEDVNNAVEEEQEEPETEAEAKDNTVAPSAEPELNNGVAKEGEDEEEEEEEEEYVEEPVEKLLEPFSKDQLAVIVKEAVLKHTDVMEIVQKLADADPAHRKIFVHGLGWDTSAETLISVFSKYGEIEDCKAVVDKISGKSKGYAFILFKHRVGAKKALQQPQKKIGTRLTSCQLASTGPVPAPPPTAAAAPPVSEYTQRKIFVSNVSADVDPKKLVDFFSQFGEIEEGPLGIDKQTGKFKGFCLFVYKSIEGAKKALEEPHKLFEATTLHCQKAVDGPKHSKPQHQHHGGGGGFRKEKRPYGGYGGGPGHMMAPSGPSGGFNPSAAAPDLAPVLGQALTALLATQGAPGIGNLIGGLGGGPGMQPGMNNQGYNQQHGSGYGAPQQGMQGGYQNPHMGGAARPPMGGAPYMGHGR